LKRVTCECARAAMEVSESGVMTWSPLLMKYQDGISFHAALLDGANNAAVEAADHMPGVHDVVHEHKLQFIARLNEVAAEAGAKDPYELGHQLAVLFEGATSLATSLNDTAALLHARFAAEVLIDSAVRPLVPST